MFTIHLPPLRERGDDLPMLVQHYVRRFSRELGREVREVAPEAMERLRSYPWPGNIRELQSVLKQALLRATGPVLVPAFLPEPRPPQGGRGGRGGRGGVAARALLEQRLEAGSEDLYEEARRSSTGSSCRWCSGRPRATSSRPPGSSGSRGGRSG